MARTVCDACGVRVLNAQRWRALNPGWVVKDWTLDELLDNPINGDVIEHLFRRDAVWEGVEVWVQLAGRARGIR